MTRVEYDLLRQQRPELKLPHSIWLHLPVGSAYDPETPSKWGIFVYSATEEQVISVVMEKILTEYR